MGEGAFIRGGAFIRDNTVIDWLHKFFSSLSPGHLDPGEDVHQAAQRETEEETLMLTIPYRGGGHVLEGEHLLETTQ